jgi:hypothetical protein
MAPVCAPAPRALCAGCFVCSCLCVRPFFGEIQQMTRPDMMGYVAGAEHLARLSCCVLKFSRMRCQTSA